MTDLYWDIDLDSSEPDDGGDQSSEDTLEISFRPRRGSLDYNEEIVLDSRNTGSVTSTPDIPASYEDMYIDGSITTQTDKVTQILQILHNDPRTWREVIIGLEETPGGESSSSPAFLAVLTSLMRKSRRLHIRGGLPDKAAYCILMAGLMMPNSVQELVYEFSDRPMNESDALILAHGLVNSTCLQELQIQTFRTKEGVGAALIEGLRNNRYLKKLELNINRFESDQIMPNLISALQDHPTLQSLTVQHHEITIETMECLGQYLNNASCQLQELKIVCRNRLPPLPSFSNRNSTPIQNKTLQHLHLHRTMICSQYLDNICHAFSELRNLSIAFNSVSDLSLLASFLCKDECKIQHLNLAYNLINGHAMRDFAPKIPHMKSLQHLLLDRNYILGQGERLSDEAALLQMITDNVEKSRSLECFSFDYNAPSASAACHAMNVNRGGRSGIMKGSAENRSISMALWPHILHRALSIKYFAGVYRPGTTPYDEKPRASVVFSLLKDHPYIFEGPMAID